MLAILTFLSLVRIFSDAFAVSLSYWVVALGAVLSVAGAIKPHRLEILERDIARALLETPRGVSGVDTRATLVFGFVIALVVMQLWLEATLLIETRWGASITDRLAVFAWIGAAMLLLGSWLASRGSRAWNLAGGFAMAVGVVLATIYSALALGVIAIARYALWPRLLRVTERLLRYLDAQRHPDWISPLLFLGLSAIAAGSILLALHNAPPVRWW